MANIDRVIAYHTARLKDKNPQVRLKAIKELELLADVSTLPMLREVYDTDDDLEVKRAAQEAGRLIYLKHNGVSSR